MVSDVSTAKTAYEQQSRTSASQRHSVGNGPGDRLSISEEARGLSSVSDSEDVTFSKLALRAVKPMSNERVSEIRDRLAEGFYTSDAVTQSITEAIADDLSTAVA